MAGPEAPPLLSVVWLGQQRVLSERERPSAMPAAANAS